MLLPPLFPHTPSATLTPIVPCPLRPLVPLSLPFPPLPPTSSHRLTVSSLHPLSPALLSSYSLSWLRLMTLAPSEPFRPWLFLISEKQNKTNHQRTSQPYIHRPPHCAHLLGLPCTHGHQSVSCPPPARGASKCLHSPICSPARSSAACSFPGWSPPTCNKYLGMSPVFPKATPWPHNPPQLQPHFSDPHPAHFLTWIIEGLSLSLSTPLPVIWAQCRQALAGPLHPNGTCQVQC